MNLLQHLFRKKYLFSSMIFMVCLLLVIPSLLVAQETGKIFGRIMDAEAKTYLPGANVYLDGTSYGAASDRNGEFTIQEVPGGSYTLKVNYVGYKEYSSEVTVPSDGSVVGIEIIMEVAYMETDQIVVYGIRQGQAKALNQQKTADNIINVVSREQMDRLPDLNTAEVLQRVPAVAIARDQGEGRYILIRGTEARLNAVSINGERIATPEDEERFVSMDVISANQVASIEVVKSLTPDMDADAIGGSVNLVSRSAFDYDDWNLNVVAGSGYGSLRENPLWQGSFAYSNRFGANKDFGLTLSGNYYNSPRGSDNNEMDWGNVDDVNDNEIPWALKEMQLRYYNVERIRYGFSGNIEYRPDEKNRYFIGGMFNQRDDTESRDRLDYKIDDGDFQSATEVLGAGVERQLKDRLEEQKIMAGSAGGQNQFGDWLMDYTLAYSFAEENRPDEINTNWELDEDADLRLDLSNTDSPQITITNLGNGNYEKIADNFVLDGYEYANNKTTNSELNASLNFKVPLSLAGNPSYIKFGGRYRNREKDRDDQVWDYGWEGDDDILMSSLQGEFVDKYLNDEYTFGPRTDIDKSRNFFESNRDQAGRLEQEVNYEESIGADYEATENITAGYALLNSTVGRWMLMAGLRYEGTQYDTKGYEVIFNEDGDYESHRQINTSSDDSQILPGLHIRYALSNNSNFRAAYSKTLARAPYYALAPYTIVLAEDEELILGNPDLKTTESQNLDLFAEYYLSGLGVLAGGVFYKSLSNIIYEQTFDQSGGPYDGFEVSQPVNGKDATLWGIEINYQQQLTSLPDFWNGFGIYANFTWTDSKATLATGRETALPGQAQTVGNFAISYEKFGFTGRFGVNYHGKYIDEIGDTEAEDIYYDEHWQWDFAASQRIVDNVRFYLEWVNITDAPLRYYIGETDRPIQREFYKWWIHTGFKFEF